MRERRWPWIGASLLLVAAGVAAALSTYLHWWPCRGTLLDGSLLFGYRYGSDFSDECLRRMDAGGPFPIPSTALERAPWASQLGIAAMVLAGAAWLVLVLGMNWSGRTKAVATLPGLTGLAVALDAALASAVGSSTDGAPSVLGCAPEVSALVALAAIWGWQPETRGRHLVRVVVVAWGATAFGSVHLISDYILMFMLSDANWDTPPLTGSLTALTILISGVLTLAVVLQSTSADAVTGPTSTPEVGRRDVVPWR
jgi:hypothetical protein